MKKILLVIVFITSALISGLAQEHNRILVTVDAINSNVGTIRVALFNSEKDFLNNPFMSKKSDAVIGKMKFEFNDLPDGEYSISIYQDSNNNGVLDKNFMGMPNEPYGISREGRQMFGPPSYGDAMFNLENTNARLTITLN